MNEQTDTDLDQADEDILTYEVSDEALEAAAGTEGFSDPTRQHSLTISGAQLCC